MSDETHEVTRETVVPARRDEVWEAIVDSNWAGERDGFVESVVPEEQLVFWWIRPGDESTRVELTLTDHEHGTRVRVVESRPLERVDDWAASLANPQALAAVA